MFIEISPHCVDLFWLDRYAKTKIDTNTTPERLNSGSQVVGSAAKGRRSSTNSDEGARCQAPDSD